MLVTWVLRFGDVKPVASKPLRPPMTSILILFLGGRNPKLIGAEYLSPKKVNLLNYSRFILAPKG